MHDELNAIRRAYGELGAEVALDADAEAEAATMVEMKTALDALPPQRPAPGALDAVVAAAGAAALGPVRAVYAEESAGFATPGAEAEVAALAEMKAALDALPPQRPPAAVLDAVVAAAGTTASLGPLRTVYGEASSVLATPEAQAEAAALAEVKAGLDALPPQRPAPALIDAVVASAVSPPRPARRVAGAADRAAAPSKRRGVRRGAIAALSTAFALMLVFGVGLWPDGETPLTEVAVNEQRAESPVVAEEQEAGPAADALADTPPTEASAPVASEQIASSTPPQAARARQAAPVAAVPPPVSGFSAAAEQRAIETVPVRADADFAARLAFPEPELLDDAGALPLADGEEELRLLYLRVQEMQTAQAGVEWGGAPVSLGVAPDSTPTARAGWMQVRVER